MTKLIDDDDDDDDDDETVKETFLGLDFDENLGSESFEESVNQYLNESYEDVSPISLLEDTDESINNINALLEQTQAIEDEVDSILSFNNAEKFSNTISENDLSEILEGTDHDYLLESEFIEEDFSDYLDEDLL